MQLLKFIPIKLTLFLVLGILIGRYFNPGIYFSLASAIISIALLTVLFIKSKNRDSILFGAATALTTIAIGILTLSIWQPKNWNEHYTNQEHKKTHAFKMKIREVLKPTVFSNRYVAVLKEIDGSGTSGKIILNTPIDSTDKTLKVDFELLVYGRLAEIKPPLNPHQFNYRNYLEDLGIYHQLNSDKDSYFLSKWHSTTIYGIAASTRNKIISKLQQANFGADELGIIQALLLGQRNAISEDTYDNYKDAGAVHILAVSGLHIGILLLLLQFLLRPLERLPKGKTLKLVVIVLLLWCFALLAGLSASVVRAVAMFSFVAYALYLNRPSNTFNILALSMFFILLLINPMLLFHVGFQMSYAAVFSIVWIYPMLQRFWFPKNSVLRKIWQLLSVSAAAQLGVLPISLFYFHQFPGLFFISNLLIVPFLGLILGMGILVMALALFNALPDFLVVWYNRLIELMNTVIEWVAQQEAFIFKNISFDAVQLVLAYVTIVALLLVLTKSTFKRTLTFLIGIIGFQLWTFASIFNTQHKETLLMAHQTKNSILLHQNGARLNVLASNPTATERLVTAYQIGERINLVKHQELRNSYGFLDRNVFVMDSLGIVPPKDLHLDYLILTQSPKINLERVLDSIHPQQIIVDGSNYKSYIERWKKTCSKRKLPFHYTGEKGAFYFE